MTNPKHPKLTTLTAILAKLEEYAHKHEATLPDEALHSLTGAIMELGDCINLAKAGL